MKNTSNILTIVALIGLLVSCSSSQNLSSYDDVYYSPGDEVVATVDDEYIDIDEREYSENSSNEKAKEEYYDPDYRSEVYEKDGTTIINNYYDDDDYYYSNRMRRFNSSIYYGFNYYDPFYSYGNWNSYDPYFWMPRPISPYSYRPGWGFGWNSNFGWTASLAWGYGGFNPYSGFGYYGGYGYNPWGYYGNVYCPPYGSGYAYNDFYSVGSNYYRGQYNSLGSYTSSSSTSLGRGERDKAIELNNNTVKPYNSALSTNDNSRPVSNSVNMPAERPREQGVRPVENGSYQRPQIAGTRPVNTASQSSSGELRPVSGSNPNTTRPASENPIQYARPERTEPQNVTRPIRDNGSYEPSTPSPRSGTRRDFSSPKPRSNYNGFERRIPTPSRNSNTGIRNNTPSRSSGSSTRSSSPRTTNTDSSRGTRGKR